MSSIRNISNIMEDIRIIPSPFEKQVYKLAHVLLDGGGDVTRENITDMLDLVHKYKKKEYRKARNAVYNVIVWGREVSAYLWREYIRGLQYRKDYTKVEYLLEGEEKNWKNKYYEDPRYLPLFARYGRKRMEESMPEAKCFEMFLETLREKMILFLIAGRGVRFFREPEFYDYCTYKLSGVIALGLGFIHEVEDIREGQLQLPSGKRLPELEEASKGVIKALELKDGGKAT